VAGVSSSICEECGQKKACVHLTDIVDGKKKTLRLCEECAAGKGYTIDPEIISKAANQLQELIAPLVAPVLPQIESSAPRPPTTCCPSCGITWGEFRKTTRFGCPRDYEIFGEAAKRLLTKIHGTALHRGRVPENALARIGRQRHIRELRGKLEKAVKGEDYEAAAALRDEIRALEAREDARRGTH
jgi:protein arginine kinase activator